MLQHAFDNAIGPFAVVKDFFKILFDIINNLLLTLTD
jgi:hypothetical protein